MSKPQLIEKAYRVGYACEFDHFGLFELVYAKTAGAAKLLFDNYDERPFIEIGARREKSEDRVLFEGVAIKRYRVAERLQYRKWRKEMEDFVKKNTGHPVLIYSAQWNSYWRAGGAGYTKNKEDAGVYDCADAWSRISHCGIEKRISLSVVA